MWALGQCPKCNGDLCLGKDEASCLQCGFSMERRILECGNYQQLLQAIRRKLRSSSEEVMNHSQ